jgi:hypothetical protein
MIPCSLRWFVLLLLSPWSPALTDDTDTDPATGLPLNIYPCPVRIVNYRCVLGGFT